MWILVARVLFVVAVGLALAGGVEAARAWRLASGGVRTQGVVISTREQDFESHDHGPLTTRFSMKYDEVRVRFADEAGVSHEIRAECEPHALRQGDAVSIVYARDDPSRGKALVGVAPWAAAIGFGTSAGIAAAVGLIAYMQFRVRQLERHQQE